MNPPTLGSEKDPGVDPSNPKKCTGFHNAYWPSRTLALSYVVAFESAQYPTFWPVCCHASERTVARFPRRQEPYLELLYSPERRAGGEVTSATVGGLARRMCDLFWPLAAEAAGFKNPQLPPVFLTLETAQYYMAYLVRPLLEKGYFESGLELNKIYKGLGIAGFFRYGPNRLPEFEDNLALRISYNLDLGF